MAACAGHGGHLLPEQVEQFPGDRVSVERFYGYNNPGHIPDATTAQSPK